MSDTPAARPPAATFLHDLVTYHVSLLTQAKKQAFEKWLLSRARLVLTEMRELEAPDVWQQRLDRFEEDVALGRYSFSGRLAVKALRKPAGSLAIAAILLDTDESEAARLIAECPECSI